MAGQIDTQLVERYFNDQAQKEHSPVTQLLGITRLLQQPPPQQAQQIPSSDEAVEAAAKLRSVLDEGVATGVPPQALLNTVLLYALVLQCTGLDEKQLAPFGNTILTLWDEHDLSMSDAAINAISGRILELYQESQ